MGNWLFLSSERKNDLPSEYINHQEPPLSSHTSSELSFPHKSIPDKIKTTIQQHLAEQSEQQQSERNAEVIQLEQQHTIQQPDLGQVEESLGTHNLQLKSDSHPQIREITEQPTRPSQPSIEDILKIYSRIVSKQIPAQMTHQVLISSRKRTLVLWLKSNSKGDKQTQRNTVLQKDGYHVISTQKLDNLLETYRQQLHSIYLSIVIMFSFSQSYNNDLILQQLHHFFIEEKRQPYFIVVQPSNLTHYHLAFDRIKTNKNIKEVPYPIELIRREIHLLQMINYEPGCHWLPLTYWPKQLEFSSCLKTHNIFNSYRIKSKIVLSTCLAVGRHILANLNTTQTYKHLIYQYSIFHDAYLEETTLLTSQKQNYLTRFGMKMLQDPIAFYLQPSNNVLIDRLIKFHGDRLKQVSNVLFPLSVICGHIREKYHKESKQKQYKNEFKCYYSLHLSEQQLEGLTIGTVIQNLGFIKANTQLLTSKQGASHINTQVVITVLAKQTDPLHQNGYCYVQTHQEYQENYQKKEKKAQYFKGYNHVLFNLLNSFQVTKHSQKQQLHTIQLQYGYLPRQYALRNIENHIPNHNESIRIMQSTQQTDHQSIIKHQSNLALTNQILDFGDGLSLLQLHSKALDYYSSLFKDNRSQISENSSLGALIDSKRAHVYHLQGQNKLSLHSCFNAISNLTKNKQGKQQKVILSLQLVYLKTMQVLFEDGQYEKARTFGQNLLKNTQKSQKEGNPNSYSKEFLLQFYGLLGNIYLNLSSKEFKMHSQEPRIPHYFQLGLSVIEQIGEYHPLVPQFYLSYSKYLFVSREPYEAVIYLNKAILITKTILTQFHPSLVDFYRYLAVGCLALNDHKSALVHIEGCLNLLSLYFANNDHRLIDCLQLQAKIYYFLNNYPMAISTLNRQIDLLNNLQPSKNIKEPIYHSDVIGIYNRYEQIQKLTFFDNHYRQSLRDTRVSYCLLSIAHIHSHQYQYGLALSVLRQAENCIKNSNQHHPLLIQVFLKISQIQLKKQDSQNSIKALKQAWKLACLLKKDHRHEALTCHILNSRIEQHNQNYIQSRQHLVKARGVASKIYKEDPLQLHRITDQLASASLKLNKLQQAKRLFQESQSSRKQLLKQLTYNQHSITLFGRDFQDYLHQVKLSLCYSTQNQALLRIEKGEFSEAKEILRKCEEELLELVGEHHPSTARIYFRLAKIAFEQEDNIKESLSYLSTALSISSSAQCPIESQIETHCLMGRLQERRKQLVLALNRVVIVLNLLKKTHKIDQQYLNLLSELQRISKVIVEHKNINYLKQTYFILSDLLDQHKVGNLTDEISFKKGSIIQAIEHKNLQLYELLNSIKETIMEVQPNQNDIPKKSRQHYGAKVIEVKVWKERMGGRTRGIK